MLSPATEAQQTHLRARDYRVLDCPLAPARRLIVTHHYARGVANTATYCHGLYAASDPYTLLGVAWWIPPTRAAAEATWPETVGGPQSWQRVLSLSRLVIAPGLPTNAASFLIGRSVGANRADARFDCLVTYADQWRGHTGAIYKATNWEYLGVTPPETVWVDPRTDRLVARKAGPHTRTREEMLARDYHDLGRFGKHKFRLILRGVGHAAKKGQTMKRHQVVTSDSQPSLWESANSPRADASPSALAEVQVYLENAPDASPQPQQVAAPVGSVAPDSRAAKPSESHRRRSLVQRASTVQPTPRTPSLQTTPLVWGQWPTAEEPLMIVSDGDGDGGDTARRWVFVREFACGKELLGVLLAPWEQRSERERVEQRWVAIERVRRVIESTAKGK